MASKTFKDKMQQKAVNPTQQFISTPEPEEEGKGKRKASTASSTPKKAHPARRAQPQYDEETKSRRVQLLLTPSLYEAVKNEATEAHLSVNEYINSTLKDAVSRK